MRSGVESVAAYVGVRGGVGREKGGESRRGKRERKGIKTDREGEEECKKKRWRRGRGGEGGREWRNWYRYQLSVHAKFPWKPAALHDHTI